jgi:serpin B
MMHRSAMYPHARTEAATLIEMPFAGGDLSLALALPNAGQALADVEQEFVAGTLAKALKEMGPIQVELTLPRFKASSALELPDVLRKLGMADAFGKEADLSGIDGTKELYVKAVMHKAVLEVNEQGAEAAGSTGIVIKPRGKIRFTADRPFMYLLRDKRTGTVLFVGRVVDPTKG